jgi:Flp pilus assembly protein TadG
MTWKGKSTILGLWRQTKGAVAVEFAIISTIFLLLIGGVIDFGFCYYMKQTITNASREGARYGVTWRGSGTTRTAPSAFTNPTIANAVLNTSLENGGSGAPGFGLRSLLPSDANPTVTFPSGANNAGYTTGAKGQPIQVQVTAVYHWILISGFVPGLGSTKTLTASTIMLCE